MLCIHVLLIIAVVHCSLFYISAKQLFIFEKNEKRLNIIGGTAEFHGVFCSLNKVAY